MRILVLLQVLPSRLAAPPQQPGGQQPLAHTRLLVKGVPDHCIGERGTKHLLAPRQHRVGVRLLGGGGGGGWSERQMHRQLHRMLRFQRQPGLRHTCRGGRPIPAGAHRRWWVPAPPATAHRQSRRFNRDLHSLTTSGRILQQEKTSSERMMSSVDLA